LLVAIDNKHKRNEKLFSFPTGMFGEILQLAATAAATNANAATTHSAIKR